MSCYMASWCCFQVLPGGHSWFHAPVPFPVEAPFWRGIPFKWMGMNELEWGWVAGKCSKSAWERFLALVRKESTLYFLELSSRTYALPIESIRFGLQHHEFAVKGFQVARLERSVPETLLQNNEALNSAMWIVVEVRKIAIENTLVMIFFSASTIIL